jgi:cytidylate kinase
VHFARKDFVKRYFNKNISNANYYDLVLNTEHLSLEQAVAIIIKAFKEKFAQQ